MISVYLSKHLKFISVYDDIFNNFSYYKCLGSDASKYLKMIRKHFLKYVSKHKSLIKLNTYDISSYLISSYKIIV